MSVPMFRSHLLQQWVARGSSQGRPPAVVIPWIGRQEKPAEGPQTSRHSNADDERRFASISSVETGSSHLRSVGILDSDQDRILGMTTPTRQFAVLDSERRSLNHAAKPHPTMPSAQQNCTSGSSVRGEKLKWRDLLDDVLNESIRTSLMLHTRPNISWTVKRLIAPSLAMGKLEGIWKEATQIRGQDLIVDWGSVRVALVPLLHSRERNQLTDDSGLNRQDSVYEPLPYVPPASQDDLNDYAAVCGVMQSIMKILYTRNDHLSCQWSGSDIIRTPALRQLVGAEKVDDTIPGILLISDCE